MMSYNTKNYTEQGAEKTVISGILEIETGGTLEVKEGATVNGLIGLSTVAENQEDSTAEDVETLARDFNALLAKLKSAGLMASE